MAVQFVLIIMNTALMEMIVYCHIVLELYGHIYYFSGIRFQ